MLPPIVLAADARILVGGQRGEREVAAAEFFPEYRKTALAPDELVLQVRFPLPAGRELRFRVSVVQAWLRRLV